MSHEEVHEMQEHAEHAHHDPSLLPVTFTMAVLAVVLAATSLQGHRTHTEELLLQNKATDQWAYYQAKNIRRHTYELFLDLLSVSAVKDTEQANKVKEKYTKEVERYRDEQNEIESEARTLENEVHLERRRANRFDLGEVCLEAAIVIASLTLLTKRRLFWQLGILMGVAGLGVALTGFLVH
ncbi:MAG: DUF4337 domain-containing protein [Terriglobia bacterium]|jgi:hypothetical protein